VLTRVRQWAVVGHLLRHLCACTFDLGCEHDNYHDLFRYVEIDDGDLDYYLMAGNSPAEVIAQFVRLIGGTHLPPRWTSGYAQTAMGLADAPDAQQQLDSFITRIAPRAFPVRLSLRLGLFLARQAALCVHLEHRASSRTRRR
jgi:alpha-glucosidase